MATKTKKVADVISEPVETVIVQTVSKPTKKSQNPGKTLTDSEFKDAFEKHSDSIGVKFAESLTAKLIRHYGAHKLDDFSHFFQADVIDAWFNPLLTVHTFKHTKGDVVTAFTDESGQRVPFTSLMAFLACQVDHSQLWEKRLKCWTDMYFKGIKNSDATWKDQYFRERNVEYKLK